ncbi:MAG: molybdopterin-guanine dinucleotide biosynthesis protein B [Gammaproteobacteria bacterium]|nr:molybdopterin-guanine dinucleotide biosynthesis protein B [Gammaproteobacteria bacterium]
MTPLPLLGFAGFSGTGKTTLLAGVLPLLVKQGVRVGMVKHAHHNFDIDQPGKDSYVLRKAGASQMLVASSQRWALMVENEDTTHDPQLDTLLGHLDQSRLDLILVEGFKHAAIPKIEVHRAHLGHPQLNEADRDIIAIACDAATLLNSTITRLNIDRPEQVTEFIIGLLRRN